jgi:rubredoxin
MAIPKGYLQSHGRRLMSKKAKEIKDKLNLEITQESLELLVTNIKSSNLASTDQETIFWILDAFFKIRLLLLAGKARLKSILAKIYGIKTEKLKKNRSKQGSTKNSDGTAKPSGKSTHPPADPSSSSKQDDPTEKKVDGKGDTPRKGGQGRNGRDDFPGGTKICVNHDHLKAGDLCPDCGAGKLVEQAPKGTIRFFGQAPIKVNIYLLQKLVCSLCGSIFSPVVPGEPEIPRDSTGDQVKLKERVYDPTVAAALACQRFQLGVPHNRLEEVMEADGLPLPASTQSKIMESLKDPGQLIFEQLEIKAATASQFYVDDTHKRVLEMERAKPIEDEDENQSEEKPKKENKPALLKPKSKKKKKKPKLKKRGTATAILAETDQGRISLFYTGYQVAGMNLSDLLDLRPLGLQAPLVVCDGLAANKPKGHSILMINCLDHARRKFYDLTHVDDKVSHQILDLLAVVYKNDKEAKEKKIDPESRLSYHQTHSESAMTKVFELVDEIMANKHSEPNSLLVGAAEYIFKRKIELSQFLRIPGAPLSNSEAERLIKTYIRHRKNSLQFFSLNGAKFGSQMMSIIQTCRSFGVSAFEYLTAIGRYATHVAENPSLWMPWNFRESIPNSC